MHESRDEDLGSFPPLSGTGFSRALGRTTRRFSRGTPLAKIRGIGRTYPQPAASRPSRSGSRKKVTVIRRRYRIIRQLGGGGYGKVYLARDLRLDIDVALKELVQTTNDAPLSQQAIDDFAREARMLAGLSHGHLPRVFDFFSLSHRSYLVMEYIEGETLESYVARVGAVVEQAALDPDFPIRGRALPVPEVLAIGIQLCEVLDYLHTHEPPVIFRDIKPTNIMRQAKSGKLFLIDFGIARHFKPGKLRDTVALGSPGYAPPEQYGKSQTTAQSDIYGLGALLHQLVTGDDPSGSANPFSFSPLLPRVQYPDTDIAGFERLLLQMVDMDVNKRPGSASEVKLQLLRLQRSPDPFAAPSRAGFAPSNTTRPPAAPGSQVTHPLVNLVQIHLPSPVACIAWSPDSSRVATGGADGAVRIWNRSGNELVSFASVSVAPHAISWSPDGRFLAVINQGDAGVQIWRADTGQREMRYANPERAAVWSAAWSPDGALFALGDQRRSVVVWDTVSKRILTTMAHPEESVGISLLCWSPDSTYLAFNGRIRYPLLLGERKEAISIWRATVEHKRLGKQGGRVRVSARHHKALYERFSGDVVQMAWSDDCHLASVHRQTRSSWNRSRFWRTYTVSLWNKNTGKSVMAEKHLTDLPRLLWWQGDTLSLVDDSGWLRRYDLMGHAVSAQRLLPPHLRVVACAPDRTVLARASQDKPRLLLLEALPYF